MEAIETILDSSNFLYNIVVQTFALLLSKAPAFGALFTAIAAGAAWCVVRTTRNVAQGQILAQRVDRYASGEMSNALKILGELMNKKRKDNGKCELKRQDYEEIAQEWYDKRKSIYKKDEEKPAITQDEQQQVERIDDARRLVAHYLWVARDMQKLRYIDDKCFKAICPVIIMTNWSAIIVHLEQKNANFAWKDWKTIRSYYDELLAYYPEIRQNLLKIWPEE